MTLPTVTPLPPPPNRGQGQDDFAPMADAFFDAFPELVADINALAAAMDVEAAAIIAAVVAAATQATLDAAANADAMFDPNNYYMKAVIDAKIAAAVAALVDSSPETLNTLKEVAAALGNDPNFATTIMSQIAALSAAVNGRQPASVVLTALAALALAGNAGKSPRVNAAGDGFEWALFAGSVTVQDFTSSGTWTKPAGAKSVLVILWGGAGGGAGGYTSGSNDYTGGQGGTGAGYASVMFDAGDLPASQSVTIGSGGAGGIANGPGGTGGSSSFGTLVAYGGNGGTGQGNSDITYFLGASMFMGGYGGQPANDTGSFGARNAGGSAGEPAQFTYYGGKSPSPCPGGGAGRGNGETNAAGYAGGAGSLRGPANWYGGGGAGGTVGADPAGTGKAGAARQGPIPGSAGGGGAVYQANGKDGGAGGSGAGGGGGGSGSGRRGNGGAGGAGFCRVITFF